LNVNSLADPGDGECDDVECTLPEAINAANENAGPDVIDFSAAGRINLAGALPTPTPTSSVRFNSATYVAGEGDGKVNITVNRSGSTTGAASVRYATSDGTAKEGRDYIGAFGLLNFDAGETSKSFTVLLIDNSYTAGARTVSLTLSTPHKVLAPSFSTNPVAALI
jgi:CSLREA domain-containing protein